MQYNELNSSSTTPSLSMRNTKKRRPVTWIALCASIVISGCASVGSGSAEEQVSKRASERWKYLVAKDIDRAYVYATPGFRELVAVDAYRARFGTAAVWLGAEVVRVECPEPVKCNAVVRLDFRPTLAGVNNKISTHVNETWLLEGGQWWIFQDVKGT